VTNREYRILCAASGTRIGVTALELFRDWYATSEQPGTKVRGIFKTLRRLARQQQSPNWGTWLEERGGALAYLYSEVRFTLSTEGWRQHRHILFRHRRRPKMAWRHLLLAWAGNRSGSQRLSRSPAPCWRTTTPASRTSGTWRRYAW
jgi:hypothetical protein